MAKNVIKVIEPISARLVSAILFSMLELPVSRETAFTNLQCNFSHGFCDFPQIRHRVAGP